MHNHNTFQNSPSETSKWDIMLEEEQSAKTSPERAFGPEVFNPEDCRTVMDAISAPTDAPNGIEATMDGLRTKHELRILADMSGAGFDNWDRLNSNDLRNFISDFPSPADFENTSNEFLDTIGRFNGPQKLAQYQQAMDSFKRKVYGAKQIYWEQLRAVSQQLPEQHQVEKNAEWISGAYGASQISKAQTYNPESNGEGSPNQDAMFIRQDEGFFGVFDGAGGHQGGERASHAAAATVDQACDKYNLKSGSDLAYVLNLANQSVRDATSSQGFTTAVLAKVIEQGDQKMLAYASVGDSRLYLVRPDGATEQITRDEGVGHRLTNALGTTSDDREHPNSVTKQYGEIPVAPGDKVVLCSDGITGDYGDDLMDENELGGIVRSSQTPEDAAANLVNSARKHDDRTAVVFAI